MKNLFLCFAVIFASVWAIPLIVSNSAAAEAAPILTVFIDGEVTEMTVEDYALRAVAALEGACENTETKKSLAVAARSCAVYFSIYGCKHTDFDACSDGNCCIALADPENASESTRNAVSETSGQLLTFGNIPSMALFTYCASSGTRQSEEFPYLTPVAESDVCEKHKTELIMTYEEFKSLVPSAKNGGESCVVYGTNKKCEFAVIGGEMITGAELASIIGSPSAEFTLEADGENVALIAYGAGHCYGMNICGAERFAENGVDYDKILEIYFPKLVLNKMNYT